MKKAAVVEEEVLKFSKARIEEARASFDTIVDVLPRAMRVALIPRISVIRQILGGEIGGELVGDRRGKHWADKRKTQEAEKRQKQIDEYHAMCRRNGLPAVGLPPHLREKRPRY